VNAPQPRESPAFRRGEEVKSRNIKVGQRWLDNRPDMAPGLRRIVEVTAVDGDGYSNGFVHGVGWYQKQNGDGWQDETWPGVKRKTRIRASQFVQKYRLMTEETP
jgi:hypothetical protein